MPDFKKLPTVNSTAVALVDHTHPADGPAAGPALWFDAGQITGLADGAAVATWPDVSGNGRNLAQGTAGNRPIYKTKAINGHPVVRFDSGDDYLLTGSFTALAQPVTVILVCRLLAYSGSGSMLFYGLNAGAPLPYAYLTPDGATLAIGGSAEWYASQQTPILAPLVLTFAYNGASSYARKNGEQIGTGSAGTGTMTGFMVGASSAPGAFTYYEVPEVLVYNQTLAADDLRPMEASLMAKYGIPEIGFASLAKWGTD